MRAVCLQLPLLLALLTEDGDPAAGHSPQRADRRTRQSHHVRVHQLRTCPSVGLGGFVVRTSAARDGADAGSKIA